MLPLPSSRTSFGRSSSKVVSTILAQSIAGVCLAFLLDGGLIGQSVASDTSRPASDNVNRRVPGFEIVQVAKPRVWKNPEASTQSVARSSSSEAPDAPKAHSTLNATEIEAIQMASRIPMMVMPFTQASTIALTPPAPPQIKESPASPVGTPIDAYVHPETLSPHPVLQDRTEAQTSTGPKPFAGVWYKKSPADCHSRIDDDTNRMLIRLTSTSFDFYESHCKIRSANLTAKTYKLSTDCISEGITSKATIRIKMLDADSLTIDAYEAAGIKNSTYRRCGSKPDRSTTKTSIPLQPKHKTRIIEGSENWCTGTILKHSCMSGNNTPCELPLKAGERVEFMNYEYEGGRKFYSVYRIGSYDASNVKLDAGCRLPRG